MFLVSVVGSVLDAATTAKAATGSGHAGKASDSVVN